MTNPNDFKYDADLLCKASFPAIKEADGKLCIVEVAVYRLNAVAVTSYMLDGFEPLLQFIGLNATLGMGQAEKRVESIFTAGIGRDILKGANT